MQDILDHVGFPVTDYARSLAFYREALAPLGIRLLKEYALSEDGADGYAGFGRTRPQFWIGTGGSLKGRLHVAFAAKNREEVAAFYAAALAEAERTMDRPAFARTITPTITAPSSSIRTATISRPSRIFRNRPAFFAILRSPNEYGRWRVTLPPAISKSNGACYGASHLPIRPAARMPSPAPRDVWYLGGFLLLRDFLRRLTDGLLDGLLSDRLLTLCCCFSHRISLPLEFESARTLQT